MRWKILGGMGGLLFLILLVLVMLDFPRDPRPLSILPTPTPSFFPVSTPESQPKVDEKEALLSQLDSLVDKKISSRRTLDLPPAIRESESIKIQPAPTPFPTPDPGAEGRQKRKHLPMGLVLRDGVAAYDGPDSYKILYRMRTGDIVRVYSDSHHELRYHIHPGVDVFLAATTKNIEAAGRHYPDADGWIDRTQLSLFGTEQAIEYTQTPDPMTFGDDANFSMLGFYERAMKNPDPVVHRIVGPRLIELVSLHEDYVSSWKGLYRDPDSKIRSLALSKMKERGVGNSRIIVEDLITRLSELTKSRAVGETEFEVLAIIGILKDTHQPRVPVAFQSFKESWTGVQSRLVIESLE